MRTLLIAILASLVVVPFMSVSPSGAQAARRPVVGFVVYYRQANHDQWHYYRAFDSRQAANRAANPCVLAVFKQSLRCECPYSI